MQPDPLAIAAQFDLPGRPAAVERFDAGHIHDTYAVTCEPVGERRRYILQAINRRVFREPEAVMENIARVTAHLRGKLAGDAEAERRTLTVIASRDGRSFVRDGAGEYWRAYRFIENTHPCEALDRLDEAWQAAHAFGEFMKMLADLPEPRLHETIPGFHDTPRRFEAFERAVAEDAVGRAASCRAEIDFFMERRALASSLLDLHRAGEMPERVTHNDTKLNNVLLDDATGRAMCAIDLDTVMPGLALYDFGDMVRTATSPAAEDERDLSKVALRIGVFDALVRGYVAAAGDILTPAEKAHLPLGGKVITFEQGIRFLADHLAGDTYYKIHRPEHNLDRTRTQIRLIESMEAQWDRMRAIVENA